LKYVNALSTCARELLSPQDPMRAAEAAEDAMPPVARFL